MPDPDLETDGRGESEPGPRDRPARLAATPDADAVLDWLRTLAALAGLLGLLLTLVTVEPLVRI